MRISTSNMGYLPMISLLIFINLILINLASAAIAPPRPATISPYDKGGASFTGQLTLNLPLMDVPGSGGMSFPIVAHYESGIRVDQPSGNIGLGWNIETGSARRIVMGTADFHRLGTTYCGDGFCQNGQNGQPQNFEDHFSCPKDCTSLGGEADDSICEADEHKFYDMSLSPPGFTKPSLPDGTGSLNDCGVGLFCTGIDNVCLSGTCPAGTRKEPGCANVNLYENKGICYNSAILGTCYQKQSDATCPITTYGYPTSCANINNPCRGNAVTYACYVKDNNDLCPRTFESTSICTTSYPCYTGEGCTNTLSCPSGSYPSNSECDGECSTGETKCTRDCGNGICDGSETWNTCRTDCKFNAGASYDLPSDDPSCNQPYENYYNRPDQCIQSQIPAHVLGNGRCEFGESFDGMEIDFLGSTEATLYDCRTPTSKFANYDPLPDGVYLTFPTGGMKFYNFGTADSPNFQPASANAPYKLKVIDMYCDLNAHTCDYSGFILTSADGTSYVYNLPLRESFLDNYDVLGENELDPLKVAEPGNMEWKLTAIISPDFVDGGDGVDRNNLDYDPGNSGATNKGSWIAIGYLNPDDGSQQVKTYHYSFDGVSRMHKEVAFVSGVSTSAGFGASFTWENDPYARDYMMAPFETNYGTGHAIDGDTYDTSSNNVQKHILQISLTKGSEIKRAAFVYNSANAVANTPDLYNPVTCTATGIPTIENGPQYRLMLTAIDTRGKGGASLITEGTRYPYEFSYYPGPNDIYIAGTYPSCSRANPFQYRDIFGYYTKNDDGSDIDQDSAGSALSTIDSRVWSLKDVSYPTGAKYTYEYEDNKIYRDFTLRDTGGAIFYSKFINTYYMGGPRLKKITADSGSSTYVYEQTYPGSTVVPSLPQGAGIINRIPSNFIQSKLPASYYFVPAIYDDLGEYVYYPVTKLTLPGAGDVVTYYDYGPDPYGNNNLKIVSGDQVCFTNSMYADELCETNAEHGSIKVVVHAGDANLGVGFPYKTEYHSARGDLVKQDESFRGGLTQKFNFIYPQKVKDGDGFAHDVTWRAIDLPTQQKTTVWGPTGGNSITTTTDYAYNDFGNIAGSALETTYLPVSVAVYKGADTSNSRETSTLYAFNNDPNPSVKAKLKAKYLLTAPYEVTTPKGTVRTTYKIISN